MILKELLASAIGTVTGPVVDYFKRREELKAELQVKKMEGVQKAEDAQAAWEVAALGQSGWKDEYWTIILSIPMVMCFFPSLVLHVVAGFAALSGTPRWYQLLLGTAVGASFGLKMTDRVWKWWST